MSSPINQQSELNRRKLQVQADQQQEMAVMLERLHQVSRYPPPAAPAAPAPRRATSWADVRAGLAMLLILAIAGGLLWAFLEWQSLGGPFH